MTMELNETGIYTASYDHYVMEWSSYWEKVIATYFTST
jgi:hypothetical protein